VTCTALASEGSRDLQVAQVSATWDELKRIPAWTPLTALRNSTRHLSGTLFQLAPNKYLICPPSNERFEKKAGVPGFIAALLWAQHEGAARRAVLMDVESDHSQPPSFHEPAPEELLPPGATDTYGSILAALRMRERQFLESAAYRIAKDGALVHRNTSAAPYAFFFRNRKDDDGDRCYAIEYRLPGYRKAAESARSLDQQSRPGFDN
jgi:hypothetical protein